MIMMTRFFYGFKSEMILIELHVEAWLNFKESEGKYFAIFKILTHTFEWLRLHMFKQLPLVHFAEVNIII